MDKVIYVPDPQGGWAPYRFAYFLTIVNESEETVDIKGRKWVVREKSGHITAVEGDGVVGEFPRIAPGGRFSYNSSHLVTVDAVAEGAFLGVTLSGKKVFVRIPPFSLTVSKHA